MYLLHQRDVPNYLIDTNAVSAATSLLVPGNTNWKGKNFTSGAYRQREVSA